jgi:UDP-glucose 4-epimerase
MRVVVTGATGNVGTSVLESLGRAAEVDSIVGIARRKPSVRFDKVEWTVADIVYDRLDPIFDGADVVIHLAWAIQPSRDEATTYSINVRGSQRVFDATAAAGVPALVYASSVGAYSPTADQNDLVGEDWPVGGISTSFYSRHKALVEDSLDRFEAENRGLRVVRLRPALIFKGEAASEVRRLFGGPFVPGSLLHPGRLPIVPWIAGLRTQAVHSADVGDAYRLAAVTDSRGAFNIAAEPVLDAKSIGSALGARTLSLPAAVVRAASSATWRAHLQPTPPGWIDMAVGSPLMSTERARTELGWNPRYSSDEAIREVLAGMAGHDGGETPPLDPKAGGPLRIRELLSGIGARAGLSDRRR